MKDAARFALAIATVLSATALDAQQRSASEARYVAESGTLPVRARRHEHVPSPQSASLEALDPSGDAVVFASDASADDSTTNRFGVADANADGRTREGESSRWIADSPVP